MTKIEWREKFGGGRKIKRELWPDGDEIVFDAFVSGNTFRSKCHGFYNMDSFPDAGEWIVVEEFQFKIVSVSDLPMVEVIDRRFDNKTWFKRAYLYSTPLGYCCVGKDPSSIPGFWPEMRQIKPTNIAQLKKSAYLC